MKTFHTILSPYVYKLYKEKNANGTGVGTRGYYGDLLQMHFTEKIMKSIKKYKAL